MAKSKINLIIDALMLLCISAIGGIGLLIKFVLVPGYKRWEIYGENVELLFRGLDRHDWGTIHFAVGLLFLFLLIVHIVLHWTVIVSVYCLLVPNRAARWAIAAALVCVTVFLFTFSYLVRPEVLGRGFGPAQFYQRQSCPAVVTNAKSNMQGRFCHSRFRQQAQSSLLWVMRH